MRKTLLSIGLAAATLTALPAAAQPGYGYDRGYGYGGGNGAGRYRDGARQELWRLSQRVDRGVYAGDLTRREANYFRREIAQLQRLDQRFGYGGYDWRERQLLDQRIDRLRAQLRFERNDRDRHDGRGDGWRGDRRW